MEALAHSGGARLEEQPFVAREAPGLGLIEGNGDGQASRTIAVKDSGKERVLVLIRRPRRYAVNAADKRPLLSVFTEGLCAGGAEILEQPVPSSAPFEYVIRTQSNERLRLIAYLFRATKYHSGEQRERPEDEHRFQIKYGSDFTDYHALELPDPGDRSTVTLFIGVHLEEGIIVGCDPTMHNPTWFSKSVEFKQEQIERARESGWFGWERERREGGRRKEALPLLDYSTETVIAFTPANLMRYMEFERVATGLDPGERLLLAETPVGEKRHALEVELGLSAREILDLIEGGFRLKVAVRGGAAQLHLGRLLEQLPGVTKVVSIDEDARPDFELHYRGRRQGVTVECKNVLRSHRLHGLPIVEYQKTRASKNDPRCGRYYTFRHCDILAACLHPINVRWEYSFCASSQLPPHSSCPGRVHPRIPVGGETWTESVEQLLDQLTDGR
jgi:hypothetical protein